MEALEAAERLANYFKAVKEDGESENDAIGEYEGDPEEDAKTVRDALQLLAA